MLELASVGIAVAAAVAVASSRSSGVAAGAALVATLASVPVLLTVRAVTAPILLAVGCLWLAARVRRRPPRASSRAAALWAGAALLLAGVAAVGVWLVPLAHLEPPTGPRAVGVRDWLLVDSSRLEPFTEDPADRRVLSVRAWYPADGEGGGSRERAVYLPDAPAVYRGIAKSLGVPGLVVSGAARLRTNGLLDAPPARDGPWPLILYSGGYRQGHQAHNTELAEELASRGYVVVGVNHPYEEATTTRADGTVLTLEDPLVGAHVLRLMEERGDDPPPTYEELAALDPEGRASRIRRHLETLPVHQESARLWRADMRSLLAEADSGGSAVGTFLRGVADLRTLGMFGMSFGGSTAGLFCATEPRCLGGVNLDGTQWGDWFGDGPAKPMLYMRQDIESWNDFWYGGAGADYHAVEVEGAFHGDFTDGFQSTPLTRYAGVLGPIGGERSREIQRAYVTAFFDRYLKGSASPLLDGPSPYPEVRHVRDPLGVAEAHRTRDRDTPAPATSAPRAPPPAPTPAR